MPWTPDSYLTKAEYDGLDEQTKIIHDISMANKRDDFDTASELMKKVEIPAEALWAIRQAFGAESVRSMGVRTETAEAKYGKNWLGN